jgi:hypothetical protein
MTKFFSPLSFVAVFGSGIRYGSKSGSRIRDKRPGSATLEMYLIFFHFIAYGLLPVLTFRVADPCSFDQDQQFRLNTDPDPIRVQGFDDENLEKSTVLLEKNHFF